jgi:excisionase family DNA binding protein
MSARESAMNQTIKTRRLLRTGPAAEYLGMRLRKLRKLIQQGQLPVVQDGEGSPWLLDIRDLDGWIERNKRTAPL